MNLIVTFSSGQGASSGYVRVGHNSGVQNEDAVWSFTLNDPTSSLTFNFTWNNTAAGTGWQGEYEYAFAISSNGSSGKQLAKGNSNIAKVTQKLKGKTGSTEVKFNTQLNVGTYYLRANQNGTKLSTMKAFSTTATGSYVGEGSSGGSGGVPARKIYIEKSIKKDDDDNTVDRLVMVGYGGLVMRSTNGTSWSTVNTGSSADLYGVDFVGGNFLAVGASGTIVKSEDSGATWSSQVLSTVGFESATYANGLWVIAGGGEIWVSDDFTNWQKVIDIGAAPSLTGQHFEGVLWDGEKFIAYGFQRFNYVSNDGFSWDMVQTPVWNAVKMVKAQGSIFALAWTTNGSIWRSEDGYAWRRVHSIEGNQFVGITYGNGRFVAVGKLGHISYSDDGENWTDIIWANQTNWNAVGYGFGNFIVVGASVANTPYRGRSTDGVTWTDFTQVSKIPTDVAFGLSQYHYDIRQACLEELQKRNVISKVEGEVENSLPPRYGEDYGLGDIVEVNAAGWQGRQRITKVRHVLEPNRISITPVIGDDFLDLRQFISREVNK